MNSHERFLERCAIMTAMIAKVKKKEIADAVEGHTYLKKHGYFNSKDEELKSLQFAEQCQSIDIEFRRKHDLRSNGP